MADQTPRTSDPPANALAGILAGDRRALARAMSAAEDETAGARTLARAIHPRLGRARVIGITGPPGAGKSTLIDGLMGVWLGRGGRIGVVAVDPSSPFSGGAILGDRIRMAGHQSDERVFIRSLAARGHGGGLSRSAARVVDLLDAAGYERIIVETVGAGQAEVEVAEIADTRIVVCPPGQGDDIQALKSGILEIADIFVVSKSDLPEADRTERELSAMLDLRSSSAWRPPVLRTTALSGAGLDGLADAIARHAAACGPGGRDRLARVRRLIAASAADFLRKRIAALDGEDMDRLCRDVLCGDADYAEADLRSIEIALRAGSKT